MTTFTDWKPLAYETFTFIIHCWDVAAAKNILKKKPRDSDTVDVSGCAEMLAKSTKNDDGSMSIHMGVHTDPDELDNADLTVPLILVKFKGSIMVIDGWHRIARAERDGVESLPCVCLTARESQRVKVG